MPALIPVLAATVLAASFVQGAAGFGFGMVAMSTIPIVLPLIHAVPLVALLGIVLNAAMIVRLHNGFAWSKVTPMALGGLLGAPMGILILRSTPPFFLQILLGLILVAYSAYGLMVSRRAPPRPAPPSRGGAAAGVVGGVLGGAFNTSGPPVIVYAHLCAWPPVVFKATLQAFFLTVGACQIAVMGSLGMIGARHLIAGAILLLPMTLGMAAGVRASRRLDREKFRLLVLCALLLLGVQFLVRAAGMLG